MHNLEELSDATLRDYQELARDIRLICFDIDGTLLGKQGHPSDCLKTELTRVQQRGIKTCFASGRPWFAARWLASELSMNAPGMLNTGATIVDPETDAILYGQPLYAEEVIALVEAAQALGLYVEVYTADDYVVEADHPLQDVHTTYMRRPARRCRFLEVLSTSPIYKILLCVDEAQDGHLIHQLEHDFPHLHFGYGHGAAHPELLFASIVSERACKKRAFEWMLAYHGIRSEQVMSFGDGGSDIPFLQQAGIGVAMANAKAYVKAQANMVTRDVELDGVAFALQRLIV